MQHFRPKLILTLNLIIALFLTSVYIAPPISHADEDALELSIADAILLALENNIALGVERLGPEEQVLQVDLEKSVFDASLSGDATTSGSSGTSGNSISAGVDISKKLESGGDVSIGISTDETAGSSSDSHSAKVGITVSHPLFRNAGTDVNLAGTQRAELNLMSSVYSLRAYVENLVAQVETAYLDYALALEQLTIYEDSLSLAEEQLEETQVLVDVGKIAGIELVASEAEVASRNEGLINARSRLETLKLRLLRLINLPGDEFWRPNIVLVDLPGDIGFDSGSIDEHLAIAVASRPDLNEARLLLERNELDVVTTKNGLLPNMELFITLGMSGYSDSFSGALGNVSSSENDFRIGMNYTYDFGERDDKARHKGSLINMEQAEAALLNLLQLAQEDVISGWIEVNRVSEQIIATAASLELQEEKLRAETAKYRVGKSTSLLVAQAQRDHLASSISHSEAVTGHRKAVIELLRREGRLLEWYGITVSIDGISAYGDGEG